MEVDQPKEKPTTDRKIPTSTAKDFRQTDSVREQRTKFVRNFHVDVLLEKIAAIFSACEFSTQKFSFHGVRWGNSPRLSTNHIPVGGRGGGRWHYRQDRVRGWDGVYIFGEKISHTRSFCDDASPKVGSEHHRSTHAVVYRRRED